MFEKIKEMLGSRDPEMKKLGETLKKEEQLKVNLHLPLIQLLQAQNPNLIVCGSTALYLQGLSLKRWYDRASSDLDIVVPFYFKHSNVIEKLSVGEDASKRYGNDFDYTVRINEVTIDVRIDNKMAYNLVTLDDVTYKVCKVEDIIAAKLRYSKEGNTKHSIDVYEMLGIKSPYVPEAIDLESLFITSGS